MRIRHLTLLVGAAAALLGPGVAHAKLTHENYASMPTATSLAGAAMYEGPLQADTVDSEAIAALTNEFWSWKVEELALDGDGVFDDIRVSGRHKVQIKGDDVEIDPGPLLQVTFKNVGVGDNPPAAMNDEGAHGDGMDTLQARWFRLAVNNPLELFVALNHQFKCSTEAPDDACAVPAPPAAMLLVLGVLVTGLAARGRRLL